MKSMTAEQRNHMLLCDPVSRVIPKLAVPTIISMLITNIYNMADTFFVSQIGTPPPARWASSSPPWRSSRPSPL